VILAAGAASVAGRPARAAEGPQADLVVTMIAVPLNVPVGGRIEYRIAVTNQGPNLASNVIVTDPLPDGLVFVTGNTTHGHIFTSQRTVLTNLGALDVGDSAVVNLVVAAAVAGTFRNAVAVNSDTPDPNHDNNAAFYPASAGPPPPTPPTPPTPPPPPVPPCAVDQSAATRVVPDMLLEYQPATKRFLQRVKVANLSRQPISGPVWLVVDALAPVVLVNADGVTHCNAPLGSPYLQLNVGPDGVLKPDEVVTMTLVFAVPANHGLTYRTRVLTGLGER